MTLPILPVLRLELCLHTLRIASALVSCFLGTEFLANIVNAYMDELASKICLRHFNQSDADDVMLWATDEQVAHFCRWDRFTVREQAVEFIKTNNSHAYMRAICLENRAIGAISVTPNSGSQQGSGAELGYVLAPGQRGKGIATRAVEIVTSTIFSEWRHLERLDALVDVENAASLRVLEKAGFTRKGILRKYAIMRGRTRDMIVFSLLPTDHRRNGIFLEQTVLDCTELCKSLEALKIC